MANRCADSTVVVNPLNPQGRNDTDGPKVCQSTSEVVRAIDEREHLPQFLSGWKEIGNYLGKGVRTAQRYERYFGLPVRRPSGKPCGAVLATRAEIDAWIGASHMRNGLVHDRITLEALFIEVTALKRRIDDIQPVREHTNEPTSELRTRSRLLHFCVPTHQASKLREPTQDHMPLLPQVRSLYFCWICGTPVDLTVCVTDEHGMAVHEGCYIAKTRLASESIKLAKNRHGRRSRFYATKDCSIPM
jgi:hypothetical protein